MGKIQFIIKSTYGVKRAYFVAPEIKEAWAKISKQSSLTPDDMKALKVMGLDFEKVEEDDTEDGFKA